MSGSMGRIEVLALCGLVRTVLPFSEPRFGSKMSAAIFTSVLLTGHLRNLLKMTMLRCLSLGYMVMFCSRRAAPACSTSWHVYILALSCTVCTINHSLSGCSLCNNLWWYMPLSNGTKEIFDPSLQCNMIALLLRVSMVRW